MLMQDEEEVLRRQADESLLSLYKTGFNFATPRGHSLVE